MKTSTILLINVHFYRFKNCSVKHTSIYIYVYSIRINIDKSSTIGTIQQAIFYMLNAYIHYAYCVVPSLSQLSSLLLRYSTCYYTGAQWIEQLSGT